ncbi:MAG: hypothetical protein ACYSW1_01170 [Planctomycetota bacterium]
MDSDPRDQRDVIDRILTHCGLSVRAPPPPRAAQDQALHELTYATDLEFVADPGPAEPVWSAD